MKINSNKILVLLLTVVALSGCRKYLDINSDPSSPQKPDLASLFTPATSIMSKMMSLDVITAGQYTQMYSSISNGENFDVHGGNAGGASANALWRSFYAQQGSSINLIVKQGIIEEKWDYVGAAIALRAWGLQMTTDFFGEMPYKQAWSDNQYTFTYDSQEEIYNAIDSLCLVALDYLSRNDGSVNSTAMARGDRVYGGDRSKWIKFVYGIRARRMQHLSNKPNYNADSAISFVDRSFTSNADNFLITHTATRNDDTNPFGPARDNLTSRRQGRFITQLLDGTTFFGNTNSTSRDPRLRAMLSASPDTSTLTTNMPTFNGGFRFIVPTAGDPNSGAAAQISPVTGLPTNAAYRQRPSTFYGDSAIVNPAINNFSASIGKFIFRNNAPFAVMAYHELQFIKAEAAFRKGNISVAHSAYQNAIRTHIDFVNFFNLGANPSIPAITTVQRDAYMTSAAVKQTPALLTLTDIMLQKYIGDFGWNIMEAWTDMRRYHYFDVDDATALPVYRGYLIPLYSTNNQGPKPAYRYRPTNFSEFDWNLEELRKLGALNIDYHTYEMWFSKP